MFLNFLINKNQLVTIFCMITKGTGGYGTEYIKPTLVWMVTTIVVSLVLVSTIYPVGIFLTTRLNPFIFMKKNLRSGCLQRRQIHRSLPLNTENVASMSSWFWGHRIFVLYDRHDDQYGTTAMHMIAVIFIATVAGINASRLPCLWLRLFSICTAMGTRQFRLLERQWFMSLCRVWA